eukprot:GHRR01020416.1.p3 GENE.GHRR01020416.1~~GHRR01020416.1.p3  ORF type:complete len:102 (+),score=9.89 GHRR01020416.1:320-625(+)
MTGMLCSCACLQFGSLSELYLSPVNPCVQHCTRCTVLQPYEFVAGEPVAGIPIRKAGDSAGGLFAGTSGPKPPPALSTAVIGMKPGGRVSDKFEAIRQRKK